MRKFEYRIIYFDSTITPDVLNEYGEEGWEFITYYKDQNGNTLIFKREIITQPKADKD